MTTIRHKVCDACQRVCAVTDAYCQHCHTSLHRAKEINVPIQHTRHQQALANEILETIAPEHRRVDADYLNLFARPKSPREGESIRMTQLDAQNAHPLHRQVLLYQLLGLIAFGSAIIFLGVALLLTFARMFVWHVDWLPTRPGTTFMIPLSYVMALLQFAATYTAYRARAHALQHG